MRKVTCDKCNIPLDEEQLRPVTIFGYDFDLCQRCQYGFAKQIPAFKDEGMHQFYKTKGDA